MRIFLFEYVSGGGMVGRPLPRSWAAEGRAMRRALLGVFAAVPGVRVVCPVDARVDLGPDPPGVEAPVATEGAPIDFDRLAAGADATLAIAPETDGILLGLARALDRLGARSLGSTPAAVDLCGDKLRLARHFDSRGVPTPPTVSVGPGAPWPPGGWTGPIVVKPRDGAGAIDTRVVEIGAPPPDRPAIAQPFVAGVPCSGSFLVDREGRSTLLAAGRQRVDRGRDGGIIYGGGIVPHDEGRDLGPVAATVASVPGLLGFVGVDYIRTVEGRAVVLEINPRPTTSIVALARLYPPGVLGSAWIDACLGSGPGEGRGDRLRAARSPGPISFAADGTIEG